MHAVFHDIPCDQGSVEAFFIKAFCLLGSVRLGDVFHGVVVFLVSVARVFPCSEVLSVLGHVVGDSLGSSCLVYLGIDLLNSI